MSGLTQHPRVRRRTVFQPAGIYVTREISPIRDRVLSIAFVICATVTTQAGACSIPVFRYALEKWQPDPYVAFVLHRGEFTAEQQKLINTLQSRDAAQSTPANLIVETVNRDTEPDKVTAILREESIEDKLPWLVVKKPVDRDLPQTVFSEELTATSVARLMDSPLRMTIKNRLLEGDSVVWVYLECGREKKDDETFFLLTQELSRLQNELKLPEIEDQDLSDLTAAPESLKIRFSAVRLSRNDDEEAVFRDMLLHVEHDLLDEAYIDQPMAFPVFGRGRALYALVGDGLVPELIEEACQFLTGACQCTVKAENPGVDLLMQVDWDNFIQPMDVPDTSLPPLSGFTGFGELAEITSKAVQASENIVIQEEESGPSPSNPVSVIDAVASVTDDVTPVTAQNRIGAKSPEAGMFWQNVMMVLLLSGCVVVAASLFLIRRSTG